MLEELRWLTEQFDQPFTLEVRKPTTLPGAGADFSFVVPGNEVWVVHYVKALLTPSAGVANRAPALAMTNGTDVAALLPVGNVIVASNATTVTWGWNLSTSASANTPTVAGDMGDLPILQGQWQLNSVTTNIQAADQWSAITCTAFVWRMPSVGHAKKLTDKAERWRQVVEALRAAADTIEHDEG